VICASPNVLPFIKELDGNLIEAAVNQVAQMQDEDFALFPMVLIDFVDNKAYRLRQDEDGFTAGEMSDQLIGANTLELSE
jgi:hypothetical protein